MIKSENGTVCINGSLHELLNEFCGICHSLRNALSDDRTSFINAEELLITLVKISEKSGEELKSEKENMKAVRKNVDKDDLPEKDREFITKFFGED